jgi:hypothetical protein
LDAKVLKKLCRIRLRKKEKALPFFGKLSEISYVSNFDDSKDISKKRNMPSGYKTSKYIIQPRQILALRLR